MSLTDIPWRVMRKTFYEIRSRYFTVSNKHNDFTLPSTTVSELRTVLRKEHFGEGAYFSYKYKGEDMNLYRPEYIDDEWEEYQTHVRAFRKTTKEGVEYCEVDTHFELDPRVKKQGKAHLKETNFSKDVAIEKLKAIFERNNIEYVR